MSTAHHAGRSRSVAFLVGVAIATGIMVAGCTASGTPEESSSEAPSSPPVSIAPSTTTDSPEELAGVIPTDCRELLDADTYAVTFGDVPLNDPAFGIPGSGAVEPRQPDPSAEPQEVLLAATQLQCAWADPRADITSLSARFGMVDPVSAESFLLTLPDDGYTCLEKYDGLLCQRTRQNEQYPVEEGSTQFLRGDIYINVVQANFPTDDLLGEFVATIWG